MCCINKYSISLNDDLVCAVGLFSGTVPSCSNPIPSSEVVSVSFTVSSVQLYSTQLIGIFLANIGGIPLETLTVTQNSPYPIQIQEDMIIMFQLILKLDQDLMQIQFIIQYNRISTDNSIIFQGASSGLHYQL